MKIGQKLWTSSGGWKDELSQVFPSPPQLVFAFGARELLENQKYFDELKGFYPDSHIITCSTAGEILGDHVRDNSIAVTAIYFEKTTVHCVEAVITNPSESENVGQKLAKLLPSENLIHALVFSDGLLVNGTALVKGLNDGLPSTVSVTGGLGGDGSDFKKTVIGLDHVARVGKVVLIGFYGTQLKIGYGSLGGWDAFGVERVITKSKENILYELDGKPALELYKSYLGDQAKGLPSTGLLFPLRMHIDHDNAHEVVRTILAVDESAQSVTFAGDMPEGATVTLMKANFERLIDGAIDAGTMSIEQLGQKPADLALLISCVGRKLVLKERIEEEVEGVRSAIGKQPIITGFYSYGELCPIASTEKQCRLHNQTMTITTFREE